MEALEEMASAAVSHNRLGWTIKCILNPTPYQVLVCGGVLYKCTGMSTSSSRAAKLTSRNLHGCEEEHRRL